MGEQQSTKELLATLLQQGDLTERELLLIDRLQSTLDEVDALEAEILHQTPCEEPAPPARAAAAVRVMRMEAHPPKRGLTLVKAANRLASAIGVATLIAGTAIAGAVAGDITADILASVNDTFPQASDGPSSGPRWYVVPW